MFRALVAAATLTACGRVAFDPVAEDGGDSGVVTMATVVHVTGPGTQEPHDLAIDGAGSVALTGSFGEMIQVGARTATTSASGGADMFVTVVDLDGTARWLYATGASELAVGQDVSWLADGSLIAGGFFLGTLTAPPGVSSGSGQDLLRLQMSASGQAVRVRTDGGNQNVQLRGLDTVGMRSIAGGLYGGSLDFGNGPLATSGADSGFLVVGDVVGNSPTSRGLAGSGDVYVNDVAIAADGSVCAAGRFMATADFGNGAVSALGGAPSAWVAKYEADLSLRWVVPLGSPALAGGVATASNGDCIASGEFTGMITVDGFTATTPTAVNDGWFARFDATTGAVAWLRSFGGDGDESAYGVATYAPDEIVVAGRFVGAADLDGVAVVSEGASDAFLAGYDAAGVRQWIQLIQGDGGVQGSTLGRVETDPTGTRVGVALTFTGTLRVGENSWSANGVDGAAVIVPIPR